MDIDAHRRKTIWWFLLPLLMLLVPHRTAAQATFDTLVNGDTIYIKNCRFSNGEIRIDSLPPDIMHGPSSTVYDAWAVLDLSDVMNIFIYNIMIPGSPNNLIEVFPFGNRNNPLIYSNSAASGFDTVYGGIYIFHLHIEYGGSPGILFGFRWAGQSTASTCTKSLRSVNITNVGGTTAVLNWVSNSDSIYVDYGCGSRLVTGVDSYLIMGLDTMTDYHVRINTWADVGHECCFFDRDFTTNTAIPPVCIDAVDLESPYTSCLIGTAEHPTETLARVEGRHTVVTDSTPYDYVINTLRTTPPGHTSSLRLGNKQDGAQGEAVIYQMLVDTMQYNILMLKYAAVLQVPDHQPNAQPKFGFAILDQDMHKLDPVCGAANFVASEDLDWNFSNTIHGPVAWKDWTTVGIDLTPYHGQFINIRFTTSDCTGGAHFGYAYIVTECFRKGITAPHCGSNPVSTLIAPPGFNYYWYTDNSRDTVSTTPEVDIVESDTYYHCRLSFIEDPSCWFEMRVWAGRRFPLADFDYEIYTTDCREFNVLFSNRSTISNDGVNPVGTGEPCEDAWWDFGNGQTSTVYSPTVHYDTTGTYNVTLVSSIGEGECKDTITVPITMPTYLRYQEYHHGCDSLTWWRNGNTYYQDTVGVLDIHPGPMSCDTAFELHLVIDTTVITSLGLDTACWSTPYSWGDYSFTDTNTTVGVYILGDTLKTVKGCDSLVGLTVVRYPKVPVEVSAVADCRIKQYRMEGHADAPFVRWKSEPPDPALEGHYTDSVLAVSPQQITTYTLVADFGVAEVCPSSKSVTLAPVDFPTAAIRVSPEYLTLDNMEYDAYDIGDNQDRTWLLHEFSGGELTDVTIPPPDRHIHRQTTSVVDSVRVILAVGTGSCTDTAAVSIPMKKAGIWAPNVFTPYLEGNNRFQLVTFGLHATEINIYNREGLLMFHSTDLEQTWDGTHNGRPCPQGVYTWRVDYIADDFPDKAQKAVGTVLLLR